MENPVNRLGQLITFASKPSTSQPTNPQYSKILDWEKYSDICRIKPEKCIYWFNSGYTKYNQKKRTI